MQKTLQQSMIFSKGGLMTMMASKMLTGIKKRGKILSSNTVLDLRTTSSFTKMLHGLSSGVLSLPLLKFASIEALVV